MNRTEEIEETIDEVMGNNPRAEEVAEMILALKVRLDTFGRERDRAASPEETKKWTSKIKDVQSQIKILEQDYAVAKFVEFSVLATINRAESTPDLPKGL